MRMKPEQQLPQTPEPDDESQAAEAWREEWWSEEGFPAALISWGPEGAYDRGIPRGATEEEFLESASQLIGETLVVR